MSKYKMLNQLIKQLSHLAELFLSLFKKLSVFMTKFVETLLIFIQKIYPYIIFTVFAIYIIYLFYMRLAEKLPRDLNVITKEQYIFYLYALSINLIFFIYNFRIVLKRLLKIKSKEYKILTWVKIKLHELSNFCYEEISITYLKLLYDNDFAFGLHYNQFIYLNYRWFANIPRIIRLIYYFIIFVLTKIIVSSWFLYETIITQRLEHFYHYIWLLLLPLICRYIIYCLKQLHYNYMDYLEEKLVEIIDMVESNTFIEEEVYERLTDDQIDDLNIYNNEKMRYNKLSRINKIIFRVIEIIKSKPSYNYAWLYSKYCVYSTIPYMCNEIENFKMKMDPYINSIMFLSYGVGFAHIIIIYKS